MEKALDTPGDEHPLKRVIVGAKLIQEKQFENNV